ncbi:MAG TPA: sugar ABC transporter permease [Candidatus Pelethocola excrementipullorum]|nr:sugar ABC transporter permease [Candidatus Pelethocola excrementipullorum]
MVKNKKLLKYAKGYLFILPNFIFFFTFIVLPVLMGLVISFTDYNGFKQFNFVGLKNYIEMFRDEYFLVSLWHNLVYTLVTVPGTIVFALLLAILVNKGIRGSGIFKTMFFLPNISSMVAVGIVWAIIFNPTQGPLNSFLRSIGIDNPPMWLSSTNTALWSVMLVAIWKQAGYYMIIILAGLQSIPNQLYEAASIDGANGVRKFFKITLPMLSPTMFMVIILSIINSFQVFDLINIMTDGGPGRSTNVLVYRIYQEGFQKLQFGYASAMAYFLFLIIMVITLFQFRGQKKWVNYM